MTVHCFDSRSHSSTQYCVERKLHARLHLFAPGDMMARNRDSRSDEEVIVPSGLDILLGRHKYCFHHTGNRGFRTLITNNLEWYGSLSTKREKSAVAGCLLNLIRSGGGRFLKEGPSLNQWYEVDDKIAQEKISHALRDQGIQRMVRNSSKSSSNKKDPTSEYSDLQDTIVSHPTAHIDETKGSQQNHFVAPVHPPDYWRYLVLETLQESMRDFKSGESKAASFNLESGTRHNLDMTQLGSKDELKPARLDTSLSDTGPAQHAATVEPMGLESSASSLRGATTHHSDARSREIDLHSNFVPQNEYASLDDDYLALQTIQESLRVSKAVQEATNASAFNFKRAARRGLAQAGSNVQLTQAPESNRFAEERHDFIQSSAWPAHHTSKLKPMGGEMSVFDSIGATKHHPGARAMESDLPDWSFVPRNEHPSLDHASRRCSVLKPFRTSLTMSKAAEAEKANASCQKRVTRRDDVSRLGSNFELEHVPNSNVFEQHGYDTRRVPIIPSDARAAQRESVTRTDETRDINSPVTTTNPFNSRYIPLKPHVVATTQWSPYAHVEPMSATSFRRHSLGDTSLDSSIGAYSTAIDSLFEDFGQLPLADDVHVSVDIGEHMRQPSLAQGANADSSIDDHDVRYTDPQLDAMLFELDKSSPEQGGSDDTGVDDESDEDEVMEDPHEWAAA